VASEDGDAELSFGVDKMLLRGYINLILIYQRRSGSMGAQMPPAGSVGALKRRGTSSPAPNLSGSVEAGQG